MNNAVKNIRQPNSVVTERPFELGEAYFYQNKQLIEVEPYLNHRDWAIAKFNGKIESTKALSECYKQGMLRLIWKQGGGENILYINGPAPFVWRDMKNIMSEPRWDGYVDRCVVEYMANLNDEPSWYKTEVYGTESIPSLNKGRRPSASLQTEIDPDNMAKLVGANRLMNDLNDHQPDKLLEFFDAHFMSSNFHDLGQRTPQNKYIFQKSNDLVYL